MATLGKPQINQLRALDLRTVNGVLTAIENRFKAIEAALQTDSSTNVAELLNNLISQPDGLVAKIAGVLTTVTLSPELVLAKQASTLSGYQLSLDFDSSDDGLVVRTPAGLSARTLLTASGSLVTIENPDGVAGDPTFHS